jgi:hypothetical protein
MEPPSPALLANMKERLKSDLTSVMQVFSDEFETDGRTFKDGEDPRWTAINKNDCKFRVEVH